MDSKLMAYPCTFELVSVTDDGADVFVDLDAVPGNVQF